MDADQQRWGILWAVERSARYHDRRRAFFDFWHRLTAGLSLIFASAAAASLLNATGRGVALGAAFVIAVLSAVDLVVGTAERARKHDDLRRRFIGLLRRIQPNEDPTPETLATWADERLSIELDEPPIYRALDLLCENELAVANGLRRRVPLAWYERCTANWLRWSNLASRLPPPVANDESPSGVAPSPISEAGRDANA